MTHYQQGSATVEWLRECAAMRAEGERPYLRWAGGRWVNVCVGGQAVIKTTYRSAAGLLREIEEETSQW